VEVNSIRAARHRQPFQPFNLCLTDGRRVPVAHPESVAMNKGVVVVLDDNSCFQTIEHSVIASLERIRRRGKGENGKDKKRPKA